MAFMRAVLFIWLAVALHKTSIITFEVLHMVIPVGELLGEAVGDVEGKAGDASNVK